MARGQWESRWLVLVVVGRGGRGGSSEHFLPLPDNAAPYQAVVRAPWPTRAPGTLVLRGSGI